MAVLLVTSPDDPLVGYELSDGTSHIGRHPACEIQLKHNSVSKSHAALSHDGEGWTITDCESKNGISINHAKIPVNEPVRLKSGDSVQVGVYLIRFDEDDHRNTDLSVFSSGVSSIVMILKKGDPEGAERLWREYFDKLMRLAKTKLGRAPRKAFDEEDVALSVINGVCLGAAEGKFERLKDSNDLWKLLVAITHHKVVDRIRRENALKNNRGQTQGESVFRQTSDGSVLFGIDQIAGNEPTPDLLNELEDEIQVLLARLPNDKLREVATMRIQGFTVPEISEKLSVTTRYIEKLLEQVRQCWSNSSASESG